MIETNRVALWYQIKSYLYSGPNVRRWPYSTKINHDVLADQIFDGGFVAKTITLEPKPSFLYLYAQIYGRNVLHLVAKVATQSFMSPKVTRDFKFANA